jgi:ABC-type nitrate/sulfonate/bicarbonate transport system ATPase subunit
MLFSCENITKTYEGEAVVAGVSLELPEGGFISLLGPSGAGKTTLFNVLAGVDRPDQGRVFLNGEDITGISGRVSYMLQKDLLLEYRGVLDNVILPLLIRGKKRKRPGNMPHLSSPNSALKAMKKNIPGSFPGACGSGRPCSVPA